jgi:LPS sulfotransferase NodH
MCGVDVNEAARQHIVASMPPARRRYVIMFTPRSGSTWLTSVLSSSAALGFPQEYLNPEFIVGVAKFLNAKTADDLLDALLRQRKSANNVFGIEVFFHLWRDNLVAQAISLFRAVRTGHFHSADTAANGAPDYDDGALQWWMVHVTDMENANVRVLQRLAQPARLLRYEDIIGDRQQAVELFARALAVPQHGAWARVDGAAEPLKLADGWNEATEARFRRERPDFVARIEASRLIKTEPSGYAHAPPPPDSAARQVWDQGQRSGAAGHGPLSNPFSVRSTQGRYWSAGWARGWDTQTGSQQ